MTLFHVLGSDIPHHNHTVLRFFNEVMPAELPGDAPRQFMVVTSAPASLQAYTALHIETFSSKRDLAQAVVARAANRSQRFFFHGQFNPHIWLALLSGKLQRQQAFWHVWGADLYEEGRGLKYQLFYLLRRMAQRRLAHVFATRGDLHHYQQRHSRVPTSLLYFPTRMPEAAVPAAAAGEELTLLLGNSGDRSNRHLEGLQAIRTQFGENVKVLVPLGYPENNHAYLDEIAAAALHLFPQGQVTLLRNKIDFDTYLRLLSGCQLGYFMFERQQGIGTLCLLIQANIPFVLNRKNPFWRDLSEQGLPVLFSEDALDASSVAEAQRQLAHCDKSAIAFFAPGYLAGWRNALTLSERERT
ncbi:TDP-N-acetylfucosamine:lipid II N-acetylfucosaminyltransferase [Pantoea rodasii]|uniref:TDP-N-acetylfucosamine:lipid II N-acetylfucosaminyltransferase n=1 Tax=Pantoea rodasii TaxID=1076549 RepID=A0A2M9WDN8_9GAMM|nr:TDP-N-acetylfucosamine:lipid II N-acetylfucosaminyltransferase [Pantoea rodasii]PJZ05619.1 TDP-N-acetylfucosamine:lipid II N-acetylfucosaminyltransferase [Pantoea rodasii]